MLVLVASPRGFEFLLGLLVCWLCFPRHSSSVVPSDWADDSFNSDLSLLHGVMVRNRGVDMITSYSFDDPWSNLCHNHQGPFLAFALWEPGEAPGSRTQRTMKVSWRSQPIRQHSHAAHTQLPAVHPHHHLDVSVRLLLPWLLPQGSSSWPCILWFLICPELQQQFFPDFISLLGLRKVSEFQPCCVLSI